MITFLLITLSIMSLIFFKYVIDTRSTIKELAIDRDKYRKLAWQAHINKDVDKKLNCLYKNLKDQIDLMIKDLNDTDFNNYDGDIKYELIESLKSIDDYSTTLEQNDMDVLYLYKG
jgi:site-specific DNA-adenine methylase